MKAKLVSESLNEFNFFRKKEKVAKVENKATIYLNAINNKLAQNLAKFDGYSNNGGIKFNFNNHEVVLSIDKTGKNVNTYLDGVSSGSLFSNQPDVDLLIKKIDTI